MRIDGRGCNLDLGGKLVGAQGHMADLALLIEQTHDRGKVSVGEERGFGVTGGELALDHVITQKRLEGTRILPRTP